MFEEVYSNGIIVEWQTLSSSAGRIFVSKSSSAKHQWYLIATYQSVYCRFSFKFASAFVQAF